MKKLTVPHLIEMISGAVILLFSFFDFFKLGNFGESAWGSGFFPIATFVALFGVVVAGQLVLTQLAGVDLKAGFVGFSWQQVRLALSFFAALLMVGYLVVDKGGLDFGIGFFFMLLGAAGLLVGSIMERTMGTARTVSFGGGQGPTPPPPPPGGGYTPPPPPPPPRP